MAQSSWPDPAAGRTVDDRQYEMLAARFSDDGLYGVHTDPAPVYADATGLHVKVRAGLYGSVRGHGWTSGDTDYTISVDANASGQTRTDRVVLRLDRSDWTVRTAVRAGTPGSGLPALVRDAGPTGVWEIHLAQVTVANGAASIGAGDVVSRPLWVGTRIRQQHSSLRNPDPVVGEVDFDYDTGLWVGYTGQWRTLGPLTQAKQEISQSQSGWSQLSSTWIERCGNVVSLRLGSFNRTGGSVSTESRLPGVIPAAYRHPDLERRAVGRIVGGEAAHITIYPANHSRAGQIWLTAGSINSGQTLSGPDFTWIIGG